MHISDHNQMFFNIGPFSFGDAPRQPPRQNQQQNQRPGNRNGGGLFGGFNEFLNSSFMNPFVQPRQAEQQPHQEPRPAYTRAQARKDNQNKRQKEEKNKKKQEVVYNENTGMYWKQKANEEYRNNNLQTAILYYNKAIELNNTESVFFSNRARCLKKMGSLEDALKDAQESVELDVDNIKGHLLCGQILAEIGKNSRDLRKIQNAINRLKKALTLCVGQNKTVEFQQQIGNYIYKAKKLLWYLKFEQVKNRRISAISEYKNYLQKDEKLAEQEKEKKLNEFIEATNENIIFQIPDYLCCKITLDLMEDPVVTESGIAYERTAIAEHIAKNGKIDPLSRKPVSGVLYPCVPIKRAIEDFLEKNPWAYDYSQGETYQDITF